MGIKRYVANADTTITNAFKPGLNLRGTGSNSGESDILEIFHIYAQESSASHEVARTLIKFPVEHITTDRANGDVGVSGSTDFFLRMFNANHSQTLPRQITVIVSPMSRSWTEGIGLDMETYLDNGTANWISASAGS